VTSIRRNKKSPGAGRCLDNSVSEGGVDKDPRHQTARHGGTGPGRIEREEEEEQEEREEVEEREEEEGGGEGGGRWRCRRAGCSRA
jgi:hypothetical protein